MAEMGFELITPGSAVRPAINCVMEPTLFKRGIR